jgi:hypothetical protein
MARDKHGNEFHPSEYDPDSLRFRCISCGRMNSCKCDSKNYTAWYPRLPILLNGGMVESVTYDNGETLFISDITTYSLQRIVDTNVKIYPTRMLVIENFIEPKLFKKLIETWPDESILKEHEPIGRFQTNEIRFNEFYEKLYSEVINNIHIKAAVIDKLGLEFEPKSETDIQLWEDRETFKINDVHIDFEMFDITFGLYIPSDDSLKEYGTEFWSPNEYTEDWNRSFRKEECDFIFKIPFIPNIIYFIPRNNKSWHSSPDMPEKINRRHLYGYYENKSI